MEGPSDSDDLAINVSGFDPLEMEVDKLHSELRVAWETTEDQVVAGALGKLLFLKRSEKVDGTTVTYIASAQETRKAIQSLLRRRQDYLQAMGIVNRDHVFAHRECINFAREWKKEFHTTKTQLDLQRCDSWKPRIGVRRKGTGNASQPATGGGPAVMPNFLRDFGPNTAALRAGKKSRFIEHLNFIAGSVALAFLICFTGCVPIYLAKSWVCEVNQIVDQGRQRYSHLLKRKLKLKAADAVHQMKMGEYFCRKLYRKTVRESGLTEAQVRMARNFQNGSLKRAADAAVQARDRHRDAQRSPAD